MYRGDRGNTVELVADEGGSSMVYVDGEATMQKFTTKEGTPTSALSIVQREYPMRQKMLPDNFDSP